MTFRTEQEAFWAGDFGKDYSRRNHGDALLASNVMFFARALRAAQRVESCIEFGANIGMNLRALKLLYPSQEQHAIEINADAAAQLRSLLPPEHVTHGSLLDYEHTRTFELVLVKGVLIHLNPSWLSQAYEAMYRASSRHLLLCEYYSPNPVQIPYRGHSDRLFKRDFCGEMLDRYPDLTLVDYGFAYHRDPAFPQDDINWFLMRKPRPDVSLPSTGPV